MSNIPNDRKYTASHEWVLDNGNGSYTIGITDHAQALLGDLVFIEQPEVGESYDAASEIAVVESVKAASDVYAPFAGEVTDINAELADAPELVNEDAFDKGWLFVIKASAEADLSELLDADAYAEVAEEH